MSFQKKRLYFEANEIQYTKIKSLVGKNSPSQSDIEKLFKLMIDECYEASNNKKMKGL